MIGHVFKPLWQDLPGVDERIKDLLDRIEDDFAIVVVSVEVPSQITQVRHEFGYYIVYNRHNNQPAEMDGVRAVSRTSCVPAMQMMASFFSDEEPKTYDFHIPQSANSSALRLSPTPA